MRTEKEIKKKQNVEKKDCKVVRATAYSYLEVEAA